MIRQPSQFHASVWGGQAGAGANRQTCVLSCRFVLFAAKTVGKGVCNWIWLTKELHCGKERALIDYQEVSLLVVGPSSP